jgi:hypothetical protein
MGAESLTRAPETMVHWHLAWVSMGQSYGVHINQFWLTTS